MAGAREIKRRIRSVENTRQITRTMELVATSKLKRAADRVKAAGPYGDALAEIVRSLYAPELAEHFPLLRQLCGAFNANLIKQARLLLDELRGEGIQTELHVAGKKGIAFFRFRGESMSTQRTDLGDAPTVSEAESLVAPLRARFESGELDALHLVGSEFRSALSTPPRTRTILPIPAPERPKGMENFILSPSGPVILERVLPSYVRNEVFRALVENVAAEQGSRRTAMKSATDNAGDMLERLTRSYNRARQAQITQEIAEIVGGAAALE
jgi:F-type H+-transporting ATPase subunit gamma